MWPLVLLLLLHVARARLAHDRDASSRSPSGVALVDPHGGPVQPGGDPSRVYYGTDTRLFDLMAGATLAFVAASRPQPSARARRALHVVGPLGRSRPRRVLGHRGHAGGLPEELHVRGRLPRLRRPRRARRRRRPPRRSRGGSPAPSPGGRCTSSGPSPTASTCGTGRSSSTSTAARTGLPDLATRPRCASRVTLAVSTASYYLVERPDPAGPACAAGSACGARRWPEW